MNVRRIDMTNDPRRDQLAYFRTMLYPYAGVTVPIDVTALVNLCKARGYSFFLTFLHIAALAANSVPPLRRRLREDGVVEYDACGTSHVELLPDESYRYCTLYHQKPFAAYLREAEAAQQACRTCAALQEDENVEGLYFMTCIPWLSYTSLTQPVAGGTESNPRISWGKYAPDGHGRLMMPLTLLVHHGLADGLHIARFYQAVEAEITKLTAEASATRT